MSFTQTSVEFQRIKSQSGADVLGTHLQYQHGTFSQDAQISYKEAPSGESENLGPSSQSSVESTDNETDTILLNLRAQLEEERNKSQRICAELAEEIGKHQHVLSLLEKERKGREEEREEREVQLQDLQAQLRLVQTQCLEMQQYKAEKEKLNREVLELKKRLQVKEDAEMRFSEEALASSALHVWTLEEERLRQKEEVKELKEEHTKEVTRVRQLLDEKEKELKFREEELIGLKDSKNLQNQAKAGFDCNERFDIDDPNLESGSHQDSISITGDILMERYLCSAPLAQSQSSVDNESFERCGQLHIFAEKRLVNCIFCYVCIYRVFKSSNLSLCLSSQF